MTRDPNISTTRRVVAIILLAMAAIMVWMLAALVLMTFVQPVAAHSFYHYECCHDRDCWPLEPAEIRETPQGWVIEGLSQPIPYDWPKVKESPDGRYHLCTTTGTTSGLPLCLYVPPASF
jgi:hypothetical protein